MRPVVLLVSYFLLVLVLGALLAPGLFFLTDSAGASYAWAAKLSHQPFHRFVHRAMLILAILGIWPLARLLGQKNITALGLVPWRHSGKAATGFLTGFVSLALVAVGAMWAGQRMWQMYLTETKIAQNLLSATLTAVFVAIVEELIFRGVIFGALKKALSWPKAALVSSAIYSLVHFFSRTPSPEQVEWSSGFLILGRMFAGFADVHALVPGFFNLLLAGMILAAAYQLTGSVYFSIGLHAGWIFWLKAYDLFTWPVGQVSWFWGTSKLIDGWSTAIVLTALLVLFLRSKLGTQTGETSD